VSKWNRAQVSAWHERTKLELLDKASVIQGYEAIDMCRSRSYETNCQNREVQITLVFHHADGPNGMLVFVELLFRLH
jgi:hypothetical protein